MFFLIYASAATKPFSQSELLELLEKSHANNSKLGITGMLLYREGNFMQLLEGEEESVLNLYDKISADPRHLGIVRFLQGHHDERQFPDWSMGFRNLDFPDEVDNPMYSEFLNSRFTGDEFSTNPTRAQRLLLSFKRSL